MSKSKKNQPSLAPVAETTEPVKDAAGAPGEESTSPGAEAEQEEQAEAGSLDILAVFADETRDLMVRIKSLGGKIAKAPEEIAAFAAERAAHLEAHVNDPNFHGMLKAEARNIGLKAGIVLTDAGDVADVAAQTAALEALRTGLGIAVKLLARAAAIAAF